MQADVALLPATLPDWFNAWATAHETNDRQHNLAIEAINDSFAGRFSSLADFQHERAAIAEMLAFRENASGRKGSLARRLQDLRRAVQNRMREFLPSCLGIS
jgi:hypothetical protein